MYCIIAFASWLLRFVTSVLHFGIFTSFIGTVTCLAFTQIPGRTDTVPYIIVSAHHSTQSELQTHESLIGLHHSRTWHLQGPHYAQFCVFVYPAPMALHVKGC